MVVDSFALSSGTSVSQMCFRLERLDCFAQSRQELALAQNADRLQSLST